MHTRPNLHIVGVKLPVIQFDKLNDMTVYIQQLIEFVKELITQEAKKKDRDSNDVTLIVLQEYAFTPHPIHSKFKSYIVRQLYDHIKKISTEQNIIVIPGTFHHHKEVSKLDPKSQEKVKLAKQYYETSRDLDYSSELENLKTVTQYPTYERLDNQSVILSTLIPYKETKRTKRNDYYERTRFHLADTHQNIKKRSVYFVGEGKDAVKSVTLKNGKVIKIGTLICFEHDIEDSVAQKTIEVAKPDFEVILSDSVKIHPERLSGAVTVHMDSIEGLNVKQKPGVGIDFKVSYILENFVCNTSEFNDSLLLSSAVISDDFAKIQNHLVINKIDQLIDYEGSAVTLLWLACALNRPEIVRYLVDQGANINFKSLDNKNFTCLDIALLTGSVEIVNYLKNKNAEFDLVKCLKLVSKLMSVTMLNNLFDALDGANVEAIIRYAFLKDVTLFSMMLQFFSDEKFNKVMNWLIQQKQEENTFAYAHTHDLMPKLFSWAFNDAKQSQREKFFSWAYVNLKAETIFRYAFEYLSDALATDNTARIDLMRSFIEKIPLNFPHEGELQETITKIMANLKEYARLTERNVDLFGRELALQGIKKAMIKNIVAGQTSDRLLADFDKLDNLLIKLLPIVNRYLQETTFLQEVGLGIRKFVSETSTQNIRSDLAKTLKDEMDLVYNNVFLGDPPHSEIEKIVKSCEEQIGKATLRHQKDPFSLSLFGPSSFSSDIMAVISEYKTTPSASLSSKQIKQ